MNSRDPINLEASPPFCAGNGENLGPRPIPILVIGVERSGTKWLSNMLCNHPDVIGVQSDRHGGIVETNMFWQAPRKFNIASVEDYIALVELWSQTDFFRLTGVDKSTFLSMPQRPMSCPEMFRILMDEFARRNQKSHWLQKLNPEAAVEVLDYFPDAKLVVTRRDLVDVVKSTMHAKIAQGLRASVVGTVYSNAIHKKKLRFIEKRRDVVGTSYENLVRNAGAELKSICQSVGIEYDDAMLDVRFEKNTSFRNKSPQLLKAYEKVLIRTAGLLCRMIPGKLMSFLSFAKSLCAKTEPEPFIRGSFSLLIDERMRATPLNRNIQDSQQRNSSEFSKIETNVDHASNSNR